VVVAYGVNENGQVVQPRVIDGLGHGCDEEAIRLVKMLQYEPVKNRGVNVTANMKLTIHFRLRDAKGPAVSYNYVPGKPKAEPAPQKEQPKEPEEKPQPVTYTFTLNF